MLFLILIYINFISLGLPDVLLGTAWPDMRIDLGVALDAAGPLSMMISGMTILSGLMGGALIRRFGTGRVIAVSTLLTAAAMLGFSLAPQYGWLFLLAIPYGLGAGAIDTGINDYVAEHYSARHMNWLHAMWGLGAMLGPMILSIAITQSGWRAGYRWVALIQFALTAVLFVTISAWDRHAGDGAATDAPAEARTSLKDALSVRGVTASMAAFLLYCAAETGLSLWGASYLTVLRGMDTVSAAMWVSIYFGGITLGRVLSGFLSMRIGSQALLRLGTCLSIAGAVVIALPLPPLACAAGMLLFGLGLAPLFPTMLHLTPARFGHLHSARIIGLQIASAYFGATFVPPVIGWVANVTGIGILPYVLIGCMALVLLAGEWLGMRAKKTGIEDA